MQDLRRFQILLAEDEPELAEVLTDALHEKGHKVIVCNSVSWVQQKLANQRFDLLIFDINLVDGTTERLIEHIRTHEYANLNMETPIIIISGFLDASVVANVRKYVQGALVKPFSIDDLDKRIRAVLKVDAA
jgi:DNA-binding response OmpR family regulator